MLTESYAPSRRRSTMTEPAQSASQLDELALSAPILEAIRECDGDTFASECAALNFLADFLASYPRCTTCGLRCSPSAKLACSGCSL